MDSYGAKLRVRSVTDFVNLVSAKKNLGLTEAAQGVALMPSYLKKSKTGGVIGQRPASNRFRRTANIALKLGLVKLQDREGVELHRYGNETNVNFSCEVKEVKVLRERLGFLDLGKLESGHSASPHLLAAKSFLSVSSDTIDQVLDKYNQKSQQMLETHTALFNLKIEGVISEFKGLERDALLRLNEVSTRLKTIEDRVSETVEAASKYQSQLDTVSKGMEKIDLLLIDLVGRLKRVKTGFFRYLLGG